MRELKQPVYRLLQGCLLLQRMRRAAFPVGAASAT